MQCCSADKHQKRLWLYSLFGVCLLIWALFVSACSSGGSGGGAASSSGSSSIVLKLRQNRVSVGKTNANTQAKAYINKLELSFYDGTDRVRGEHLFDRSIVGLTEDQESVVVEEVPAPREYFFEVKVFLSDSDDVYASVLFWASVIPGEVSYAEPVEPEPEPSPSPEPEPSPSPSPEPTEARVTMKFALAQTADNESDVPFTVTDIAIAGYMDDTKLYPSDIEAYKVSKDTVEVDGQVQIVALENVPLTVNRFAIEYLASDSAVVARSHADDLELSLEGPNEIIWGSEGKPIEQAQLTITFAENVEYPSKADQYNVRLVDSTGTVTASSELNSVSSLSPCGFTAALNTASVSANWYRGERMIARTIVSGDDLPQMEAGQSYSVVIDKGLIGTTNVNVSFASGLELPTLATTYDIVVLDREDNEIIKSETLDIPVDDYTISGVPVDAKRVMVHYYDAEQQKLAISRADLPEDMSIDKDVTVTIYNITTDMHLNLTNCYVLANPITEPVNVTLTNAGRDYELSVPYSSTGDYELTIPAQDYDFVSVSSIVLKYGNVPFEWLDYSTPITENNATLDVNENEFANGSYDAAMVMEVANPRHLDNIRNHYTVEDAYSYFITGKYKQIKDIDFAGSCGSVLKVNKNYYNYKIYSYDVDHADSNARFIGTCTQQSWYGWKPIGGDYSNDNTHIYFAGNYDGGGFAIKNMVSQNAYGGTRSAGLFGTAIQATLQNINLDESCQICGYYAGGICGLVSYDANKYSGKTTISNCHSSAFVFASGDNCGAGGICGSIYSMRKYSSTSRPLATIKECSFRGNVSISQSSGGTQYAGGILGSAKCFLAEVISCDNYGQVETLQAYTPYIGGVVGAAPSNDVSDGMAFMDRLSLKDCTNAGSVIISSCYSSAYLGGILGGNYRETVSINNCQNNGDVIFSGGAQYNNPNVYIGGIIGNGQRSPEFLKATNSTGTISAQGENNNVYIGGIAGYLGNGDISATQVMTAMGGGNVGTPEGVGDTTGEKRGLYCGYPKVNEL